MKRGYRTFLGLALVGLAWAAAASDDPGDKTVDQVLAAMARTPTWGHPDQANEFAGMHDYHAGRYHQALAEFKEAAHYADKLSQLSIGLMYLNGQGVRKDPVEAFAWVAIAAERKYPRFLATRDSIWAGLDATQRERARSRLEQLYAEYGDATAKLRMAKVLRRGRAQMAGSYLGFGNDSVVSLTPAQFAAASPKLSQVMGAGAMPQCGAPTIDGIPMVGCGNIYVAWRWDPKLYFEYRDASWEGTVRVGEVEQVRNAPSATAGHKASHR